MDPQRRRRARRPRPGPGRLPAAAGVFAARGRDTVGLGVDTANATGAPRLYERHGLTLHHAVDTWETVVR